MILKKISKSRYNFPQEKKYTRKKRHPFLSDPIKIKRYFENQLKIKKRQLLGYKEKKKFFRFTHLDRAAIAKGLLSSLNRRKSVKNYPLLKNLKKLKIFLKNFDLKKKRRRRKNLCLKKRPSFQIFKEKLKVFLRDRLNKNKDKIWGSRLMLLLNNVDLLSNWKVVSILNQKLIKLIDCVNSFEEDPIYFIKKPTSYFQKPKEEETLFFVFRKIKQRHYVAPRKRFKKKAPSFFPFWFQNLFFFSYKKHKVHKIIKNLKILKFLLRFLKFYKNIASKKRIFFFNILIVVYYPC